jgi:hypothetical protein
MPERKKAAQLLLQPCLTVEAMAANSAGKRGNVKPLPPKAVAMARLYIARWPAILGYKASRLTQILRHFSADLHRRQHCGKRHRESELYWIDSSPATQPSRICRHSVLTAFQRVARSSSSKPRATSLAD